MGSDGSALPLLAAQSLSAGYGGEAVITDCSLDVREGQVVLLMGRNGVGKTTLISTLSGRIRPLSGEIQFDGRRIERLPTYRRSRLGIAHVPQGREVIPSLSVRENLLLASGQTRLPDEAERVFESFPILSERLEQRAGSLSGGEQQMLAVGRALVGRCTLLLLDEPSTGLAPLVVEDLFTRVADLVTSLGLTVLLVEQQIATVWRMGLADYAYVLESGGMTMEGTPDQLDMSALQGAYLGASGDEA